MCIRDRHVSDSIGIQLYSYTVTYVPTPGFENRVPYVIGMIELDEGVRIIANMLNLTPEEAEIGMRVKVAWEKLSDDITYFAFEPDKRQHLKKRRTTKAKKK